MKILDYIFPKKYTIDDTDIYLLREADEDNYMGKIILRSSFLTFIVQEANQIIEIGDIQCEINNRGIGSLMMKKLIDYANNNNFKVIKGWISDVDKDHIDRLTHFYKKHGFIVTPRYGRTRIANIEKILSE